MAGIVLAALTALYALNQVPGAPDGVMRLGVLLTTGAVLRSLPPEVAQRNAGESEAILPAAVMLIRALRQLEVRSYRVTAGIAAEPELYQRLVEGSLPIVPAADAEIVVTRPVDRPAECTVLASNGPLQIADCP